MVPHPLTSLWVDRMSAVVVPLACLDNIAALLNVGRSDEQLLVWRPALLLPFSFKPLVNEPPAGKRPVDWVSLRPHC